MPDPSAKTILVADDQEDIRKALRALLGSRGFQVVSASSPRQALRLLASETIDLALVDLNYSRDTTSGDEGLDLLSRIAATESEIPVVVMTAFANVSLAVESLQRGARDFVEKPWDNERLLQIIRIQLELEDALHEAARMREAAALGQRGGRFEMIAESTAMQPVLQLIERVAPTDASVLITGEHGTGKGVAARALHSLSKRATNPLITVNVGALSDHLFESELFGHVQGAFTGAATSREGRFRLAHRSSLFLDEIGNLSAPLQAKLLRVIESGEFERVGSSRTERADVRLISATNADLPEMIERGDFREDLLFRLNAIEIRLPPLRERREDIGLLAESCLERLARQYRRRDLELARSAVDALEQHLWPGNVRELEHALQRGVLMADGSLVEAEDLGLSPRDQESPRLASMTLEELEREAIRQALLRTKGNMKEAASQLGLGRSSLYRRLEKYSMHVGHEPKSE